MPPPAGARLGLDEDAGDLGPRRLDATLQRTDGVLQLVGAEATLEIRAQAHFAFRLPFCSRLPTPGLR